MWYDSPAPRNSWSSSATKNRLGYLRLPTNAPYRASRSFNSRRVNSLACPRGNSTGYIDCASNKAHRGNSRLSAARTVTVDAVKLIDNTMPLDCLRLQDNDGDIRPLVDTSTLLSRRRVMNMASMAF